MWTISPRGALLALISSVIVVIVVAGWALYRLSGPLEAVVTQAARFTLSEHFRTKLVYVKASWAWVLGTVFCAFRAVVPEGAKNWVLACKTIVAIGTRNAIIKGFRVQVWGVGAGRTQITFT